MKKTDVQTLSAPLDAEDEELMKMFKGRNRRKADDLILVQQGRRQYLIHKEDESIQRKRTSSIIRTLSAVAGFTASAFLLYFRLFAVGDILLAASTALSLGFTPKALFY